MNDIESGMITSGNYPPEEEDFRLLSYRRL